MNTPRIDIPLPPFFANQSRWKAYNDCNRLYAWPHVAQLIPTRKYDYFEVGIAAHKAHERINAAGASDENIRTATAQAVSDFQRAMGAPLVPGDDEKIQQGSQTLARMIPAYYAHYGPKGQLWKPLGMELSFCVEVGEDTNVFLVGRLDNLATYLNGLWIVDTKTMAKLDMREFIKYEIDVQLTAYIYGATKQLSLDSLARGEKPVIIRGAIIDGMVKTTIPQFHREMYTRSVDDLREFELEFCMKVWEIAAKHAIIDNNRDAFDAYSEKMWELGRSAGWKTVFPKNTQQCFRYGTCAYRDLCVRDNDVRRMAFKTREADYVDEAREAKKV